MFWGTEKDGKSTVATWDAVQATKLGLKVLWLSFDEGVEPAWERFEDEADLDPAFLYMPDPLDLPRSFSDIKRMVSLIDPDIIYVDTLTSACTELGLILPDTSESEKWMDLMMQWRKLATDVFPQKGVVVLSHAIRSGERYAGSFGKGAASDMNIGIKASKGGRPGKLTYNGRWYVSPKHFVWDESIGILPAPDPKSVLETTIYEYVKKQGPVSRNTIVKGVKGRRSAILRAVKSMEKAGSLNDKNGLILHGKLP
jgi:hypothetical protein